MNDRAKGLNKVDIKVKKNKAAGFATQNHEEKRQVKSERAENAICIDGH